MPWIIRLKATSLPRVNYGGFHYKHFEKDNVKTIKNSKDSFATKVPLSQKGITNILSWHESIVGLENDVDRNLALFSLIVV